MKWPWRNQHVSYVLIKTKDETIQGVMVGKSLHLERVVRDAKKAGLMGIEVGTLDHVAQLIPFEDIVDFTSAPYDGPHWWKEEA